MTRASDRLAAKRKHDREAKRAARAAMTPEERAERRRENDAAYREKHRDDRRAYDRERVARMSKGRWSFPGVGSNRIDES